MKKFFSLFALVLFAFHGFAQDRPNILWLVTEDMSPYLSSYGNKLVKTPNLDKLAAQGIRYTQARSNGPQCSPARSTLISGKYAVSLGTDIHREGRPVPAAFYFPKYLREAGYYTSNNAKKDYNDKKTPEDVWHESSNKASYTKRPDKSQPFFSVFNCGITHMVRVATRNVQGRDQRTVPMDKVPVPGYVPDLPEVRNDIAWNMDAVMLMDKWMGEKLAELEKSGEAENTIIFFYADHGGTVPRGKAYVYESGTRVPLIVYFPKKWQHLANTAVPSVSNRQVSFVDFSATVLNLAGVKAPDFLVGKPFLGPDANKPENTRKYTFAFRANQGDSFAPSRGITNGQYKLIWNYQSAYPNGTRQDYQWQMPAQQAWDVANMKTKLSPLHKAFWVPVETFELYDLQKDSLETKNLAQDKAYSKIFNELKAELQREVRQQKDLGFMPREYRKTLQEQGPLFNVVRKNNIDVDKQIGAAETASLRNPANLKTLTDYLADKDPVVQYWGASGICGLAKTGQLKSWPAKATAVMGQAEVIPEVKSLLAEAMVYAGNKKQGLDFLLQQVKDNFGPAAACLQNVGAEAKPIAPELQALLEGKSGNKHKFYLRSILINCGVLPYSALYQAGEKTSD
ncbi:sulfatase family protein [Rufibacter quisquiliarum]|uniref:Arylsulfatase A-like enzyme n=1 Tax=Rufibacter quisquiliarum TaxID=1549639 RepID=A0A839GID6_9BACT|nr:sulfatase [Rufibacter quisquiliarum]MBA9078632.1 arylsulfatase A-like enzyme [Rufibacter quisquiliarum]